MLSAGPGQEPNGPDGGGQLALDAPGSAANALP